MDIFASDILFYIFGALAVLLSLMVVFLRNPVSSAMMMALSFGAVASIMFGLGAHFLGILQILVYSGAIMVLFAFIIMLLNVKEESSPLKNRWSVALGVLIAALFIGQLSGIVFTLPGAGEQCGCPLANAEKAWDDLQIGQTTEKNAEKTVCSAFGNVVRPAIQLPAIDPALSAAKFDKTSNIRKEIDNGEFPDTALLGNTLYSKYNRALVITGLALLVASIGVVVLSRRPSGK